MSGKGKELRKQAKRPHPDSNSAQQEVSLDEGSLLSSIDYHVPLLLPKKEKDYSDRPPSLIPRDPRQRATSIDASATNELPNIPVLAVVKQEPMDEAVFHSEIEIKEERLDESEMGSDWKEQWLNSHQSTNPATPEPNTPAQVNGPNQIAVSLGNVNIKQEPNEEPEQQPCDDQCSVDSGSTVGLPSPKRMECFSGPSSPAAAEQPNNSAHLDLQEEQVERAKTQPSKSRYSAPLDLEEEERLEQEREALQSKITGYSAVEEDDDDESETDENVNNISDHSGPPSLVPNNESMEGVSDQSGPPALEPNGNDESLDDSNNSQPETLAPPTAEEPAKKKNTFQVLKNPEVFRDVPESAENSSHEKSSGQLNESMETDGAPRINKLPAKVTKQNRSSMLVEDYLKAAEKPPTSIKRTASAPANKQQAAKRQKSAHESVDVHVDLNGSFEPTPGPSRDPRLNKAKTATKPTENQPPPREDLTTVDKNNIIRRILKWNGKWIDEHLAYNERNKNNKSQTGEPSILQGLKDPRLDELSVMHTLSSYATPRAYLSIYHALLLYEIWWSIIKQFNKLFTMKRNYVWNGLFQAMSQEKRGKDDIKLVRFTTMIHDNREDKKEELKLLNEGDLVSCQVAKHKSPESLMIFGYVMSVNITYGMRNKRTDHRLSNGDKDILIEATVAFREGYLLTVPSGLVALKKIASLKSLMALFDYEGALSESPVQHIILKPDVNTFKLCLSSLLGLGFKTAKLDTVQSDAVLTIAQTLMMARPEEPKISLLEGAPGTGKTHVIGYLVEQLLSYTDRRPRILYCAPTDSAVDDFCRRLLTWREERADKYKLVRLGSQYTTHPRNILYTVSGTVDRKGLASRVKSSYSKELELLEAKFEELARQRASISQDISESENAMNDIVTDELRRKLDAIDDEIRPLAEELDALKTKSRLDIEEQSNAIRMDVISEADVVCTTMDPATNPELDEYLKSMKKKDRNQRPFLCCIIDDAAQCWEPGSLLPLCFGINKFVLVGDTDPLYNPLNSTVAKSHGLSKSLFARFQDFANENANCGVRLKIKLQYEYRMDPAICHWPGKFYYGNNLLVPEVPPYCETPLHAYRVLDVKDGQEHREGDHMENEAEARVIAKIVVEAFEKSRFSAELTSKSVAIVTFTEKQKELISKEISKKYLEIEAVEGPMKMRQIEVALAKDLQGKEKDIVFVSCVKAAIPRKRDGTPDRVSLEFITDCWNAAMTRAKETLVVVGKLRALLCDESETLWDFVADAEKRQVIREVSSTYHTSILYDTLEKPDI